MNIETRISRIRRLRTTYGFASLIALFLLSSVVRSGITISDLVSFVMLLPLPLYFILKTYHLNRRVRSLQATYPRVSIATSSFSLISFLTQSSLSFRLSLFLLLLTVWTVTARSYNDAKIAQTNTTQLSNYAPTQ